MRDGGNRLWCGENPHKAESDSSEERVAADSFDEARGGRPKTALFDDLVDDLLVFTHHVNIMHLKLRNAEIKVHSAFPLSLNENNNN